MQLFKHGPCIEVRTEAFTLVLNLANGSLLIDNDTLSSDGVEVRGLLLDALMVPLEL